MQAIQYFVIQHLSSSVHISLHHLLRWRKCFVSSPCFPWWASQPRINNMLISYTLKQVVLEIIPVLPHITFVDKQLYHDSTSLEVVLDGIRICTPDCLLTVLLCPRNDGLRLPLTLVDRLFYKSLHHHEPTLIEVTEHHQSGALLWKLVCITHSHVKGFCKTDAVSHGHASLHIFLILIAVLLAISTTPNLHSLEESTDVWRDRLVGSATPERKLMINPEKRRNHPCLVQVIQQDCRRALVLLVTHVLHEESTIEHTQMKYFKAS